MERTTWGIVVLGFSFMFIFTAFQTQANIQELVIKSIQAEDPSFKGSGYVSLATTYAGFSVFLWLAPSCLAALGPVKTIFIGGITFVVYVAVFLWPHTWLLYASSVLVGAGGAVIWTAQGNYLTLMSNEKTMARNTGIFWVLFQSSFLFGNIFVVFMFKGQSTIDSHTRFVVFLVLTVVASLGVLLVPALPRPGVNGEGRADEEMSIVQAFLKAVALFKEKNMMLLSFMFFYNGIEIAFFTGVYGYCISSTTRFRDPNWLVGIAGILMGVGEILGGVIFGLLGYKTMKAGRDPVVIFGFLVYMLTFFLIFLNLPMSSPLGPTSDPSYLPNGQPSEVVALVCSFLLGFGDACIQTQIFDILGCLYPDNSGPAFALFQFVQCVAATISFLCTNVLNLYWLLIILTVVCTAGTYTFCLVEWRTASKK